MPSMTYLPDWLAWVVLVMSFMRINSETIKRIQNISLLIIRYEKGANTLRLAIALPGTLIQAVILWFFASLLNERASFRGWRGASQNMDRWHSPFILLSEEMPLWKQNVLKTSQSVVGLIFLIWLTADSHSLYRSLLQLDGDQVLFALREILATPGFWLWAYRAISVSISLLPTVSSTFNPPFWGLGLLISLLMSAIMALSSAEMRSFLMNVHENTARGLLAVLLLQLSCILLYSSVDRICHFILRFLAPQANHQPETEDN